MTTDTLLELFSSWGAPVIFVTLLFGAIGIPLPSSILLVAAGAMMAQGDMPVTITLAAAAAGAIIGDQIGYQIGRSGGRALAERFAGKARLDEAEAWANRWGGIGVFLSRWLVSPIGPWVNIVVAAARYPWPRFTLWAATGELVWVAAYAGIGYAVGHSVETLAATLADGSWMLVAAFAVAVLGWRLRVVLAKAGHG